MTLPRLLLIKAGSTHPEVVRSQGDYDEWFRRALPGGADRCTTISVFDGEALPSPAGWGGAIVTGSPSSVRDEAPWMARLSRWALDAAGVGLPILGVCFGHQLLGEALGGRVDESPAGWELGTIEVELTDEGRRDPLFAGLPPVLVVQSTHRDELIRGPPAPGSGTPPPRSVPRTIRLAGNDHSAWQAFAAGSAIRAVQFHPEVSAPTLRKVLEVHEVERPILISDHGVRILHNWQEHFVRTR